MIIRLMGANFSANNIGELTTWNISWKGDGYTYDGELPRSVTKNDPFSITVKVASGYTYDSVPIAVKMGGTDVPASAISRNANGTITINIASVTGKLDILIGEVSSSGGDTPVGNVAYYAVNKNLWSDGEIQDQLGRIAITTYFPTNGKELSASSSITTAAVAKRYYDSNKVGGATAADSAYGRVVLVVNTDGTSLVDTYAGETLTVNGTVYTLQPDPAYIPQPVKYATKTNIGADGQLVENYSEFRVSILDYFETDGKQLTVACSLGGTAVRYYDANKVGGITDATKSTYARVVIHTIAAENQNDAAVEGTALTVNGKTYILSNN